MAKNSYPPDCQAVIDQFSPAAGRWAVAGAYELDDVRQAIAQCWWTGEDPAVTVPKMLGLRSLPIIVNGKKKNNWWSKDLHVVARSAEHDDDIEPAGDMPRPKARRGSVAAGVAADCAVGLRAAQKRLKRQRDAAERGQGDLFAGDEAAE